MDLPVSQKIYFWVLFLIFVSLGILIQVNADAKSIPEISLVQSKFP